MDLGIGGRRALVTGGSSGLGLACAQALAAEGVAVAIASRSADKLAHAASTITGDCLTIVADVSNAEGVDTAVAAATAQLGGIDILVANAGGPPPGGFDDVEVDAYPGALELNLMSTIRLCTATVPAMRERRWGRVVAITSTAAREPIDQLILSNTARAGLTAFLKTLARTIAADGVTVNSLQPGLHATDRLTTLYGDGIDAAVAGIPAGELGDPADFGRVAAMLCSTSARFVSGAALIIDGAASRSL